MTSEALKQRLVFVSNMGEVPILGIFDQKPERLRVVADVTPHGKKFVNS